MASADLEGRKAHDGAEDGQGTEDEGEDETGRGVEDMLAQEDDRNSVDYSMGISVCSMFELLSALLTYKIASQIEGKVDDERLRRIEDTASTLFLRPLHGNVLATEEGVVPEDGEVASRDEGRDADENLAHAGADL